MANRDWLDYLTSEHEQDAVRAEMERRFWRFWLWIVCAGCAAALAWSFV